MPAGFREAWAVIEGLWAETVARAEKLDPALLHERVDDEWSFMETLRHLVFATDAWVRRGILGDPSPWDPLDLPWDQMRDTPGIPSFPINEEWWHRQFAERDLDALTRPE